MVLGFYAWGFKHFKRYAGRTSTRAYWSGFASSLAHNTSVWITSVERVKGTDGMTTSYNSTWDAYDPAVKGTCFGQDMITVDFKDTNHLLGIIPSIIGTVKQKGTP